MRFFTYTRQIEDKTVIITILSGVAVHNHTFKSRWSAHIEVPQVDCSHKYSTWCMYSICQLKAFILIRLSNRNMCRRDCFVSSRYTDISLHSLSLFAFVRIITLVLIWPFGKPLDTNYVKFIMPSWVLFTRIQKQSALAIGQIGHISREYFQPYC